VENLDKYLAHHNTGKTWNKEKVKTVLSEQPMVVIFAKANGEPRNMYCSLVESDVEPYIAHDVPDDEPKKQRPDNPNVLSVIDLEKKAWRSFKIDSIIRVMVKED